MRGAGRGAIGGAFGRGHCRPRRLRSTCCSVLFTCYSVLFRCYSMCYSCDIHVLFTCYSKYYSHVIYVLFTQYSRVIHVLFTCYSKCVRTLGRGIETVNWSRTGTVSSVCESVWAFGLKQEQEQ
jgi:hypothetical protein